MLETRDMEGEERVGVVIKVQHKRSLSVGNVQYLDCGAGYMKPHHK